ncbi:hypothetical protein [Polaribacter sp. Q13]|uniref:hypothetical protein n=1 Tax=Polaribacter sp. Q13 TaxID=2806551 RepID=UPI00193B8D68|nr:hypothetical protein [Polaribacter sp. Q13]QVY64363.1 hypothetical protein JOP69_11350 [Polaribacter sp. Q13]
MKKLSILYGLLFFTILFFSCSNVDDELSLNDTFFDGAQTSATDAQLEGKWSIYQIKYEKKIIDVPASVKNCGRDFFNFQSAERFKEYVFVNSECTPQISELNWSLSNGIITFNTGLETDQWVITELTSNRLVFKLQLDVDSDGELEVYQTICNRYEPPTEFYSGNFFWDSTVSNQDKILLQWDEYKGYNEFEKYEIYRLSEGCNTNNLELITTITDVNVATFVDENPPAINEVCYLFKIHTDKGLLESISAVAQTDYIKVPSVNLSVQKLNSATVNLNWDQYEGYYFSHYKITVRNYSSGSGGGYQEEELASIDDIKTTNYSTELPYFNNPVFVISVYNIFGSRNDYVIEGNNQQTTNFTREEILPVNSIKFLAFSPDETILYYSDNSDLYRYNYATNTVENSIELNSSSIIFIKVFKSSFGTEVIVNIGGTIAVYDVNLNFKYNLNLEVDVFFSPDHLIVNEDGYWLATDREKLYSFARTGNNLKLISTNNLYNNDFSSSEINIIDLGENRILAANRTKSQNLIVEINSDGELSSNSTLVDLNITPLWKNNYPFSKAKSYLINTGNNTVYDTNNYNLISTLNQDFFPTNISNDGSLILGTNNNPNSFGNYFHEKKVRTLSYPSFVKQEYESKGYPHFIFQNHLGQLISISKGLVGDLDFSAVKKDIFIEVIE